MLKFNLDFFINMTVGFDTGSKWFDNYFEAYYEVIECYYDSLNNQYFDYSDYYKDTILPTARQTANSLKGVYRSLGDYYEDYYKNYFNENSWSTIWAGYGYGDCDVDKIISKWGFSSKANSDKSINDSSNNSNNSKVNSNNGIENSSNNSNNGSDIIAPAKFNKKSADKITNFNPSTDTLEIDTDSFGLDSSATFAAGKNMKAVKKKLANQGFDFLYDEKKGGLYFNENGTDKGFGDGGIIAILKGAPDLTSGNLVFI